MRRTASTVIALFLFTMAFAQQDTIALPRKKVSIAEGRSNDHFLIQLGYTNWTNKPDSIHTSGIPRTFNMYLMLDFPFKTDPHWSVALGPGISTDNIFFSKTYVGLKDQTTTLRFQNVADTNHFKKYKLATAYLEAPIELRYRFNPNDDAKSVKIAIGARVGTLLNAHVKGKELVSRTDATLNEYISKENSKRFLNRNRLSLMARIGIGHYTAFATYSVTPVFKDGVAPPVRPLTIGLTLSGL